MLSTLDVFGAAREGGDAVLSVCSKIGSGSFGEVFSARVLPKPYAEAPAPFPTTLVVKRCILGRVSDSRASSHTSETRETSWARECGGSVPWREILDAECVLLAGAGAGSALLAPGAARDASSAAKIFLPLSPTFMGACLANESVSRNARVFHLLATAVHGTSLYDAISDDPDRFARDVDLSVCIAAQVLRLVAELHGRAGCVHRDIKLQNLLLAWSPAGAPIVRLCDFGCARISPTPVAAASCRAPRRDDWAPTAADMASGKPGSPFVTSLWYRAPELLCGGAWSGPPADAWAVAVALAELFSLPASLSARLSTSATGPGALATARGRKEGTRVRIGSKHGELKWGSKSKETSTADDDPVFTDDLVTLFHCGPEDAHALLAVINILGLPAPADVDDMRLPAFALQQLGTLCEAIRRQAAPGEIIEPLLIASLLKIHFNVPIAVAEVLSKMLQWSPSARLTCAEALSDEAFARANFYVPKPPQTAGAE